MTPLNEQQLTAIKPECFGGARAIIKSLIATIKDAWDRCEDLAYLKAARSEQGPREPVLIVAHGDGWLDVYAEKHVDVHIVNQPWMETPASEILAEEWVAENIPWRYRPLLMSRRQVGLVRKIRPSEIAETNAKMEILKILNAMGTK